MKAFSPAGAILERACGGFAMPEGWHPRRAQTLHAGPDDKTRSRLRPFFGGRPRVAHASQSWAERCHFVGLGGLLPLGMLKQLACRGVVTNGQSNPEKVVLGPFQAPLG